MSSGQFLPCEAIMNQHCWDLFRLGYSNFALLLLVPEEQRERMNITCFRTLEIEPMAGNFRFWGDFPHLMRDDFMCRQLAEQAALGVQRLLEQKSSAPDLRSIHMAFTIEHPDNIGWQSTLPREAVPSADMLENFQLNKRTPALRVLKNAPLLAPATRLVTFKAQLWLPDEGKTDWSLAIHTVYPGEDIGNLHPRNPVLKHHVFFDWTHPGEPIPQENLTTQQRL